MYAGAVAALLARGSGATPWGWQLVHDALHHRDGELGELVQRPLDQPPALLHLRERSRSATAGETPVGVNQNKIRSVRRARFEKRWLQEVRHQGNNRSCTMCAGALPRFCSGAGNRLGKGC